MLVVSTLLENDTVYYYYNNKLRTYRRYAQSYSRTGNII